MESYDGSDNPISLVMKRRLIVLCPFDFQSFPFGRQTCTFRFYLQGRDNELAEVKPKIANIGPRHFGPYLINNWTIEFNYNKFTNTKYTGLYIIMIVMVNISTILREYIDKVITRSSSLMPNISQMISTLSQL